MKRNVPNRGDVLHVDLEPTKGREQRGKRFVLVLSPASINRFGLVLVCPITQGGEFAREHVRRPARSARALHAQFVEAGDVRVEFGRAFCGERLDAVGEQIVIGFRRSQTHCWKPFYWTAFGSIRSAAGKDFASNP